MLSDSTAYVVQNVTYSELRPLAPADGDDYTYTPRPNHRPPLIPPQWVPIGEYHALAETVRVLADRVTALERRSGKTEGET